MVLLLFVEWVAGGREGDEGFECLAHGEFVQRSVGMSQAMAPPSPKQCIDRDRGAVWDHAVEHHEGIVLDSLQHVCDLRVASAVVTDVFVQADVVKGRARGADRRLNEGIDDVCERPGLAEGGRVPGFQIAAGRVERTHDEALEGGEVVGHRSERNPGVRGDSPIRRRVNATGPDDLERRLQDPGATCRVVRLPSAHVRLPCVAECVH